MMTHHPITLWRLQLPATGVWLECQVCESRPGHSHARFLLAGQVIRSPLNGRSRVRADAASLAVLCALADRFRAQGWEDDEPHGHGIH